MKDIDVDKVVNILNEYIDDAQIGDAEFNDDLTMLGMSSIQFIQIIVALEEEFECEIPDTKLLIMEMNTVEKILSTLQEIHDKLMK